MRNFNRIYIYHKYCTFTTTTTFTATTCQPNQCLYSVHNKKKLCFKSSNTFFYQIKSPIFPHIKLRVRISRINGWTTPMRRNQLPKFHIIMNRVQSIVIFIKYVYIFIFNTKKLSLFQILSVLIFIRFDLVFQFSSIYSSPI